MENLKVLIVEDEILIAEDLMDTLTQFGIREVRMAHTRQEAYKQLEAFEPDVALLDIRMENEKDGLEIGNAMRATYNRPFIYITAHSDLASIAEIVKSNPAGYITKPFKKSDLFAAITLVQKQISESLPNKVLKIKDGFNTVVILFSQISYIESEGNYIIVHHNGKRLVSRQSLESIYKELDEKLFFKISRSYIINLKKVASYSTKEVVMEGNIRIPVSRNIASDFQQVMTVLQQH